MKRVVLMLALGAGLTVLGAFVIALILALLGTPSYGPLMFLLLEVAWIVYAAVLFIRGVRSIRSGDNSAIAKGRIAFSVGVVITLGIVYAAY